MTKCWKPAFLLSSANDFNFNRSIFCELVKIWVFITWHNSRLVKFESICSPQHKCDSNFEIYFDKDRKHYGNSRKCWDFLPCFQMASYSRSLNIWIVWERVKTQGCVVTNFVIISLKRLPAELMTTLKICKYYSWQIKISMLTLSQTSPDFYVSAVEVFWKHCGKRRNCSWRAISPFPTVFSTHLENYLPFSSNLELSSKNSVSLEESKICRLGKG